MKTAEIDFSAPVAILKSNICSKWRTYNIYKVKYYASFLISSINYGKGCERIYCGDPEQVKRFAAEKNLALIPMNNKGRKFFEFSLNK